MNHPRIELWVALLSFNLEYQCRGRQAGRGSATASGHVASAGANVSSSGF